jgi:hypothetical protein
LLAVVCRRGDIRGRDVGNIRVERNYAIVEVANAVADHFATEAAKPDPRDPRVTVRAYDPDAARPQHAAGKPGNPFARQGAGRPQHKRKPFKKR